MPKLLVALLAIPAILFPFATKAVSIVPGDLIKASGDSVYYYDESGKRDVFFNSGVYFSWYPDFLTVKTITDGELAAINLGKNVTYRPGIRLLKITTDPKVYAIEGRMLRPIADEFVAESIWGSEWAKLVDDAPDTYFASFDMGKEIKSVEDYATLAIRNSYPTIQSTLASNIISNATNIPENIEQDQIVDNATGTEIIGVEEEIFNFDTCSVLTSFAVGPDASEVGYVGRKGTLASKESGSNFHFDVALGDDTRYGILDFKSDALGVMTPDNETETSNVYKNDIIFDYTRSFIFNATGTYAYTFTCKKDNQSSSTVASVSIDIF